MQRFLYVLCLATCFIYSNAQTGFYIKPANNFLKFYKNNDEGFTFISKTGSKVEVSTKNFYQTFPDILLGLSLGYHTGKFFFECGYFNDATSNYVQLKYYSFNPYDSTFFNTRETNYSGIAQRSLHLKTGIKMFERKSVVHKKYITSLYFVAGVEMQHNYGTHVPGVRETSYTPNGTDIIKINIYTNQGVQRNFHPSVGFLLELKNDKDFNLFNLSVSYSANLRSTNFLQSRSVVIEDVDGVRYTVGNFTSTGSGLYLGISKNIYYNRVFKKKKSE